jgi:hypothetical protein
VAWGAEVLGEAQPLQTLPDGSLLFGRPTTLRSRRTDPGEKAHPAKPKMSAQRSDGGPRVREQTAFLLPTEHAAGFGTSVVDSMNQWAWTALDWSSVTAGPGTGGEG